MNILIAYYRTVRELDSNIMLKIELEKRGHYVEIMQITSNYRWLCDRFYKYDIILANSAYDDDTLSFKIGNVFPVKHFINLQWEQIWGSKKFALPTGVAKDVIHVCWGEYRKDLLINHGVKEENAIISGPMHFDFCRPELRQMLKSRAELSEIYSLPNDKKWILFIGCFYYTRPEQKEVIEEDIYIYKHNISVYPIFVEWLKKFAQRHPEIICIYRPHQEEEDGYQIKEIEEHCPNFHVIPFENMREWINASEHCCTGISSAIADIYMLNKTATLFHPKECIEDFDLPLAVNPKLTRTYEEFEEDLQNPQGFPCDTTLIDRVYAKTEKPAYINVCDVVEAIDINAEKETYYSRILNNGYDISDVRSGKTNALAFLVELLEDNCIYLCEAIANILELGGNITGFESNAIISERDHYKQIKNKQIRFSKVLGIEYNQTLDIGSSNKINPEVECFDAVSYNRILTELIETQFDSSEEKTEELLDLMIDLFYYKANLEAPTYKTVKYMMPFAQEIAKAIVCKMRREKYEAPEHLRGSFEDFVKPLKNKKQIIVYGAGREGKNASSLFTRNELTFEIWDRDYENIRNIVGFDVLPPYSKAPSSDLIVALCLGHQDQYYEVERQLKERGYEVINGVFAVACFKAIVDSGNVGMLKEKNGK